LCGSNLPIISNCWFKLYCTKNFKKIADFLLGNDYNVHNIVVLVLFLLNQLIRRLYFLRQQAQPDFVVIFLVNVVLVLSYCKIVRHKKKKFFCSSSLIVKVLSVKKNQVWQKVKCHPAWISRKNAFLSRYLSLAKRTTFSNWIISLKTFDF
jgi:hypothetical protein